MKVYGIPDDVPLSKPDYNGSNRDEFERAEKAHFEQLILWAKTHGYNGPRTGQIYHTPMADGYAQYMVCDNGAKSFLMHLPYIDGYHDPNVQFVPKAEVYKRIDRPASVAKLFSNG